MNKAKGAYGKPSRRPASTLSPRKIREKGPENLFKETMAENLPKLWEEMDIQIQEAKRHKKRGIQWNPYLDTL